MANLIGQQRGNFKLTQLLGQGGFAEVYLGENIHVASNKVAIKILYAHLDDKGKQQFKNEANTLTSLIHPHIIRVTDFGFDNGIPYLIMEYAPKGTLANHHQSGTPLPISTVVDYIKQVADALQYAHDNKIIHRDVKPANMLIGTNNSILLSDFGIARVMQTYTIGTKDIAGSSEYMSPEQGKAGAGAVFASDQYSLGIVAYQWLCGNLPFQGDNFQLMVQHRLDAPPPFPATLHIPSIVEYVIMKALAKDPQERFTNVQAFAEALEKASTGKGISIEIGKTTQSTATEEPNPPPVKTIDYAVLDALYDEGVKARAKGDLEHALLCWQKILDSAPSYLNGTLQTRVEGLKQELRPLYVERLRRKALTFNSARNWDKEIETWQALLQLAPQDSNAQEMRQHAQNNKTHEYLYTSAKRYIEQNNISAAKAELKELETYAPRFGDPEKLHETIQSIEWEASKPIREEEARRAQEIALADARRAQEIALAETKKKTDATLNNILLSVFLLPSGLAGIVGILTQSITLAAIVAVIIGIILRIYFGTVLRKPHTLNSTLETKFIIGAIFSIGLVVLVTWYASTFDYTQLYGGSNMYSGGRLIIHQIQTGFFLGIIAPVLSVALMSQLDISPSKRSILGSIALMVLFCYLVGNTFFSLVTGGGVDFGLGFGWYWTFIAIAFEYMVAIGIISLLGIKVRKTR